MAHSGNFKPGNPGKPKGAVAKTTAKGRELFLEVMEGQIDHVEEALTTVKQRDPAKYLDLLSKLLPYFMPKKVDVTSDGKALNPLIIDFGIKSDNTNPEAEGSAPSTP